MRKKSYNRLLGCQDKVELLAIKLALDPKG